jgi:HSP20 family protein
MLTVSGERKERASGRREYHAMEVKVGPFERSFRLPKPVDAASLKATYELGFLEIRLAKLPLAPPRAVGVERK